ncbi:hypothetical protein [Rhizobium straminoryzae]|uniref:Phage protein n=1 Tax=Rhizobium straminoryzae TaxID=1387186 RepID=A0A549TD03_9HYPH|nr:hypothetical protein [Rhizobium straminoryzae]TRL39848.1 hypothetical protein FNA46_07895 [Rhizobium straminoryzae]
MSDALWTAESNQNYYPPQILRYDPAPKGKTLPDGRKAVSMTFPVLQLTDWVAQPDKVADEIARRLNATEGQSKAALDVLLERRRQVQDEKFSPDHDDRYQHGELERAAASYALYKCQPQGPLWWFSAVWAWPMKWFKSKSHRENLVRAAALLIAAIECIDRAEARSAKEGGAA